MTTTETPTLEQVLALAHKLPRQSRAELIGRLARELAVAEPPAEQQGDGKQGYARWQQLREELRASFAELGPDVPLLSEQLERDRAERQTLLEGQAHVHS